MGGLLNARHRCGWHVPATCAGAAGAAGTRTAWRATSAGATYSINGENRTRSKIFDHWSWRGERVVRLRANVDVLRLRGGMVPHLRNVWIARRSCRNLCRGRRSRRLAAGVHHQTQRPLKAQQRSQQHKTEQPRLSLARPQRSLPHLGQRMTNVHDCGTRRFGWRGRCEAGMPYQRKVSSTLSLCGTNRFGTRIVNLGACPDSSKSPARENSDDSVPGLPPHRYGNLRTYLAEHRLATCWWN